MYGWKHIINDCTSFASKGIVTQSLNGGITNLPEGQRQKSW